MKYFDNKNKKKNIIFMKFFLLFLLLISFFLFIFFSVESNKTYTLKSNVVLNTPNGYNDKGFVQGVVEGTCLGEGFSKEVCEKKQKDYLKKMSYSYAGTSNDSEKIKEHVDYYIKTYGIKNFIIAGFTFNSFYEKYLEVYEENKKTDSIKFVGFDTWLSGKKNNEWYSNFWQVNFLHYYSGYHAGIYSAAWALENKEKFKDSDLNKEGKQIHFGSIGGLSINCIFKYALGFKLGINMFNKMYQSNKSDKDEKIEFIHKYYEDIGSFDASDIIIKNKVEKTTENMFNQGASIIFMISSSFPELAINAAQRADEKNKQKKEHFIVGVDVDTYNLVGKNSKKKVITSAMLLFQKIIKNIYKTDFKNNEKGKDLIIGGHEYGSIPERDKKNKIWKKYFDFHDGKYKRILNIDDLPKDFLGFDNEQIVTVKTKIEKKNIKYGWIDKFINYITDWNKKSYEEYKRALIMESGDDFNIIKTYKKIYKI